MIVGLHGLLDQVLAAVLAELDPVPGRVLIAPGAEVAWDSCCDGQLWVRVVGVEDASSLLNARPGADGSCSPVAWLVTLGVGVLRCSPSVDDRGRVPAAGALTENARELVADMEALVRALTCRIETPLRSLAWAPLGPEGGCAGGEWTFSVVVPACGCEE